MKNLQNGNHLLLMCAIKIIFLWQAAYTQGASTNEGYKTSSPLFSHQPGVYTEGFMLSMYHPDHNADIYYTLDGSKPDSSSFLYNGAIHMYDRSVEPNTISTVPTNFLSGSRGWDPPDEKVRKGTVIRAIAIAGGSRSDIVTATYFVFEQGMNNYSLPVISIATDSLHLFSDESGLHVPGDFYTGADNSGNYFQRGIEWERPASLEFFESDGSLGFQQDIGIRIHGGFSRRFAQKSFRLYARSEYGASRFNYPIFPDMDYGNYNRLILRNSGNDFGGTMFMDAAAQSLIRHFNVDTQAYRPAIIFINGEYWGILNIRERYDRHYLERVYGVNSDRVQILTNRNTVKYPDDEDPIDDDPDNEDPGVNEPSERLINEHYENMVQFIDEQDLSVQENMDYVATRMDIDNYLDYFSAQIYYGNTDWPQSNIDFWRYDTEYHPNAPKGHDGRWRWLLFDADRSLGLVTQADFDMIEWVIVRENIRYVETGREDNEWPNLILRNLLENEQFYNDFINRLSDHLNTAFLTDRVISVIDSLKAPLEPVINEHISRWPRNHRNRERWDDRVQGMYLYATHRPRFLREHMMKHFDLGESLKLTVNVTSPESGFVRVNTTDILASTPGVGLDPYPWSGTYFSEIPVRLKAVSSKGYTFSHWETDMELEDGFDLTSQEIIVKLSAASVLTAHFKKINNDAEAIHYWAFSNSIPNNTPLHVVYPVFSKLEGSMLAYHAAVSPYPPMDEEATAGIMDRVNDPTSINFFPSLVNKQSFHDYEMRGIRVRNPSLVDDYESQLIFHLPTTGFENPEFTFAAVRTVSGQRELRFEYSVDPASELWTDYGLKKSSAILFESYKKVSVSLEGIDEAGDNPYFSIRILFGGDEAIRRGSDGNVRFNNIGLFGNPLYFTSVDPKTDKIQEYLLDQNYPNPFNPLTVIRYQLPIASDVRLEIFNVTGQRVATLVNEHQQAGFHQVNFDAHRYSSGIYLYRIQAGGFTQTRKMTILK
jgi:hypothetical protein